MCVMTIKDISEHMFRR